MSQQASDRDGPEQSGSPDAEKVRGVWLTNRDRELFRVLAAVRYLSTDQVARMFFEGKAQSAWQTRLLKLAALGKYESDQRYLRRLQYRTYSGKLVSVWALDEWGRAVLGDSGEPLFAPEKDVSAYFLEHTLGLNELYARAYPALSNGPRGELRWHAAGRIRLDWIERVPLSERRVGRRLEPDAIVELPGSGKRLLVEYETGAHPVSSANKEGGSTQAKLRRYAQFFFGMDKHDRRHIDRVFPNGMTTELIFVVPNATRRDGVNKLIAAQPSNWKVPARAVLLDGLVEELIATLRGERPAVVPERAPSLAEKPRLLSAAEQAQVMAFIPEVIGVIHRVRQQIRAFNEKAGQVQLSVPDYPPSTSAVAQLVTRCGRAPT